MMANYKDLFYRVRSELSEISEITFSEEELFGYACEGARILHGMIATINPSFLLSDPYYYNKLSAYLPYTSMGWYADYVTASQSASLPEQFRYLDINEDGVVDVSDYNAIVAKDVFDGVTNTLYTWLLQNNKGDSIDFSVLPLPRDCMFVHDLYITESGRNFKLLHTNLDNVIFYQAINQVPSYYTRTGNNVRLAPSINQPTNIKLFYIPTYTDPATDETDFGIPDTFIPFVVEYVVLRAHNRNDRKTLVEQSFLNQKGELIQSILGKESMHIQVIPTLTNYPYTNVR